MTRSRSRTRSRGWSQSTSAEPFVLRVDFGSGTIADGFVDQAGSTYDSELGYGWTTSVPTFDRGAVGVSGSPVSLYRDGVYGSAGAGGARTFRVAVPVGGSFDCRAYVGDAGFARENIQLQADGGDAVIADSTLMDQYATPLFSGSDHDNDGLLNITIQDLDGSGFWTLLGLDIATAGYLPEVPT